MDNKAVAAVCLYSLASVKVYEGKTNEATAYNRQALALAQETDDHTSELYSLITGGYIAYAEKDFSPAESDFRAVIDDKRADNYLRWEAEASLSAVYVEENRQADAEAYFRKELMTTRARLDPRSSVRNSRLSFLSRPISFYEQYMQFLASHHRDQDALEVAELSRANTLAEGLGFSAFYITFPIKGFAPRATAERLNSTILSYWIGIDIRTCG